MYLTLLNSGLYDKTDKMQQGVPLSDEDRIPWLETLRDVLKERILQGEIVVLACSALQNRYREILRSADSNYKLETYVSKVLFILLDAAPELIASRLEKRAANGEHFMPPTLLKSQLELLKIDESEGILRVDATLSPEAIVNIIKSSILEFYNSNACRNP